MSRSTRLQKALLASLLVLLPICQTGIVFAGSHVWTSIGPAGQIVYALAIDPAAPSTIYAGTDGGVFKSTNGGSNWSPINTGLTDIHVYALAIDPVTPTILYVGTRTGGVFKSTNGGDNWSPFNTGLTSLWVQALAIDPVTPTKLYAGTWASAFAIDQSYRINLPVVLKSYDGGW